MALYAFDGTSRQDEIENEKDTNVVRFARAYRGRRFYRPGVGTRFGWGGKVFGGWLGAGLHQRVDEAIEALNKNIARGDLDIDVVGFSRGAAAALHFANQVWEKVGQRRPDAPRVRFVGLFDTVASTGILPGPIDINLDLELPPNVGKCCHAMALDDGRASFDVRRVKPRDGATLPPGTIEEVWFRGCHSDIGGGDQHELLASIPLAWMLRRAADAGLQFDAAEVGAALDRRDRTAPILRAPLDRGLKKRKPRKGDAVHCSVRQRQKVDKIWHVNPPVGCAVVGDWGEVRSPFPNETPWPVPIDWRDALQPQPALAAGGPAVQLEVHADTEWNDTPHLFLQRDALYEFAVVDGPHEWVDGTVADTNGADGYDRPILNPFKHLARFPDAGWYALTGAVDRAELFRIGSKREYRPRRDGEFGCFANDAWFKYGNNRGRLGLSVRRLE